MASESGRARHTLIAEGTTLLADAGLSDARSEARRLWADVARESPGVAVLHADAIVARELAMAYAAALARRAAGEPLAHVTGTAGFRHLVLRSDGRALIPRPETEGLVDLLLARVRTGRVADVGTGTGCLALSLATEGGFDTVVATDRSAEALALAAENRRSTGARVSLVRGDLCAPLGTASLDALVSNPPYLTVDEYVALDPSVRDWEPRLALESGSDGLDATRRLLDQARAVLRPGGWLAIEVDATRAAACAAVADMLGWCDVRIHADLFGRERYLLARRSDAS